MSRIPPYVGDAMQCDIISYQIISYHTVCVQNIFFAEKQNRLFAELVAKDTRLARWLNGLGWIGRWLEWVEWSVGCPLVSYIITLQVYYHIISYHIICLRFGSRTADDS